MSPLSIGLDGREFLFVSAARFGLRGHDLVTALSLGLHELERRVCFELELADTRLMGGAHLLACMRDQCTSLLSFLEDDLCARVMLGLGPLRSPGLHLDNCSVRSVNTDLILAISRGI